MNPAAPFGNEAEDGDSSLRNLSVDEALQRTPFTSINPFNPGIIPVPSASSVPIPNNALNSEDAQAASAAILALDAEADGTSPTAVRLEQTLQNLRHLLRAEDLPRYEFRSLPQSLPQFHLANGRSKQDPSTDRLPSRPKLGSFAQMLLSTSALPYNVSPSSPSSAKKPSSKDPAAVRNIVPANLTNITNEDPFYDHRSVTKANFPRVLVPSAPSPSDYKTLPEANEFKIMGPESASGKRKRDLADVDGLKSAPEDLEAINDAMSKAFTDFLGALFEAEENDGTYDSEELFAHPQNSDEDTRVLTPQAISRLDTLLNKMLQAKRFNDVPVEDVSKLQRICQTSILASFEVDLAIKEDSSDEDVQTWAHRMETTDAGLRVSRTYVKMLTAGRPEKELYSEEVLSAILNGLRNTIEQVITLAAQLRSASNLTRRIRADSNCMGSLNGIYHRTTRLLKTFSELILSFDISEAAATTLESMCIALVFTENAPSEKESLMGIQKFENVRRGAMETLSSLFLKLSDHRRGILDEILSSLEKLPVTRQNARHYKVAESRPIQLVSALLMQFVQICAIKVAKREHHIGLGNLANNGSEEAEDPRSPDTSPFKRARLDRIGTSLNESPIKAASSGAVVEELMQVAKPRFDAIWLNAVYVANFLVTRASTSTKTGDTPFRNLLDIFTEDFINVLGIIDWPGAAVLLEALLTRLLAIVDDEKSSAPAKNMALDIMGLMGAGIADLRMSGMGNFNLTEGDDSGIVKKLSQKDDLFEAGAKNLLAFDIEGPYRAVVEHLDLRSTEGLQLQSARDQSMILWARTVWTSLAKASSGGSGDIGQNNKHAVLTQWLRAAIEDPQTIDETRTQEPISTTISRLCHVAVVLRSPFCKALRRILTTLLKFLSSPHATVRSRSLKSVVQLIEKDISLLDQSSPILAYVIKSAGDTSTMVRDSALGLIGRCLSLRPQLWSQCFNVLTISVSDPAVGVRKRAIRTLKDINPHIDRPEVRVHLADTFLRRMSDEESSVVELASQCLEEIWLFPLHDLVKSKDELSPRAQNELNKHAWHIVETAQSSNTTFHAFKDFFRHVLGHESKNLAENDAVCKSIVRAVFDSIIDNIQDPSKPSRQACLSTLTVFASVHPQLFDADQMVALQPYVKNLATQEDVVIQKSVVDIYTAVLPILPPMQHDFLFSVQQTLLSNLSRLPLPEMDGVMKCLHVLDGVLKNTDKLVRLVRSVLVPLRKSQFDTINVADTALVSRTKRYLSLAGTFGKNCNIEAFQESLKEAFPNWKGGSCAGFIVDSICPFAEMMRPQPIREMALEALCMICQSWPKNYLKQHVTTALEMAFNEKDAHLQKVVIAGFRDFYFREELNAKDQGAAVAGAPKQQPNTSNGADRLGQSMILSDNDGAATSIAQRFLPQILRIALSSVDDLAVVATEFITSTNRQGLAHPRECVLTLVALETSPNKAIAKAAFEEHMSLNSKHESILEKEYLRAVEQAFAYQRDTVKDPLGFERQAIRPKLHLCFEVMKHGSITIRKKIFTNLCRRLDFNVAKLPTAGALEQQLLYAKFVCQNLALADFARLDEINVLVSTLEGIFATTGNALAQRIEPYLETKGNSELPPQAIEEDNGELSQLSNGSMLLILLWQTRSHLRSTWNLASATSGRGQAGRPPKDKTKDLSKPAARSVNAPAYAESYIRNTENIGPLPEREAMIAMLRRFLDLLSTDPDARVVNSDEEDLDDQYSEGGGVRHGTPLENGTPHAGSLPPSGGSYGSRGARRKSGGVGSARSTPSGRKRGRPPLTQRQSTDAGATGSPHANRRSTSFSKLRWDDEGNEDEEDDVDGEGEPDEDGWD